jgi:hypothetical protein
MKFLSVVTVVKDNQDSLKSTGTPLEFLNCPHVLKVIDCGKDMDANERVQAKIISSVTYLYEPDKNLCDAKNKWINPSSRSQPIFVYAGDETSKTTQIKAVLEDLGNDEGVMGYIRRKEDRKKSCETSLKPSGFAIWLIMYGIKPTSHRSAIYTSNFLREISYDANEGLVAEQYLIINLLGNQKGKASVSESLSDFQSGGLENSQSKEACIKQMHIRKNADASPSKLVPEDVLVFSIAIIEMILSTVDRSRILRLK